MAAIAESDQGAAAKRFLSDHHIIVFGNPSLQQADQWDITVSPHTLLLERRLDSLEQHIGMKPHGVIFSAEEERVVARLYERGNQENIVFPLINVTDVAFNYGEVVLVSDRLKTDNPHLARAQLNIATGEIRQGIQKPIPFPLRLQRLAA